MTSIDETKKVKEKEETKKRPWLIRPCNVYMMEHMECVNQFQTYRGKTNTIYIHGKDYEEENCNKYVEDFNNCNKWTEKASYNALEKLLKREEERLEKRRKTVRDNDVWEYRTAPPDDWNDPLPKRLQVDRAQIQRQACVIS